MRIWFKVNVRVEVSSFVDCSPIDVSIALPVNSHIKVGARTRYSSTVAVQVMVYLSPAVRIGTGELVTVGAWRAGE